MGAIIGLLAGPATGLFGSLLSNLFGGIAEHFKRKQELEAQRLRQDHETSLLQMNIAARGQEMESEQMMAQMEAAANMLASSYDHDASYGQVSQSAAVWFRAVRPVLTFALIGLVAAIYFTVNDAATITIGEDTMTIRDKIVVSVLFMCEAAMFWWFADRRTKAKP